MSRYTLLFILFHSVVFGQVQIASVPFHADLVFNNSDFSLMEGISSSNAGMSKVNGILNAPPYILYSTNDFWPAGAWGRGYATELTPQIFANNPTADPPLYFACHPLARRCANFITGHLNLLDLGYTSGNSLQKVKDGIDFLLTQQYPANSGSSGAFAMWYARESQYNLNMNLVENKAENYSTSYALQALCEYYLSGVNHRRPEVLNAIQRAETYLLNRDWVSESSENNNVKGLAIWALCDAYKITKNCNSYKKIKEITNKVINEQDKSNSDIIGTWQTGGSETVDGIYEIKHDTKIMYHFMILRGLIEVLNTIPDEDFGFKSNVCTALKLGVNHVINCRLMNGANLRYAWRTTDLTLIYPSPLYADAEDYDYQNFMESAAKLHYYANNSTLFNQSERSNLRNLMNKLGLAMNSSKWRHFKAICQYSNYKNATDNSRAVYGWTSSSLNYNSPQLSSRMVRGDFDNDGFSDDIIGFYDYGNQETKAHQWKSNGSSLIYNWVWAATGYDANKITDRVVSGDFDNDGYIDDIVGFYDYGNDLTKIHLWKSDGVGLAYSHSWTTTGYDANKITGRVVSGDFDNDGYVDDIAAFYDYGNDITKIHLWNSNGTNFVYSWSWSATGYDANKITKRIVSGDFDNDGSHDDIAAFYDYGPNQVKLHTWKYNGSSFTYTWPWSTYGYDATKITGRVVSGDFDGDGTIDDIAAFYDYGNEQAKLHRWLTTNNSINYSWWWQSNGYNLNQITGRVLSGDYDQNCRINDLAVFYDYGIDRSRVHVWTNGNYNGPASWWLPCPNLYSTNCGGRREAEEYSNYMNESLELTSTLKVYPNPFENELYIELGELEDAEIWIFNSSGVLVHEDLITNNKPKIMVGNLDSGVYFLEVHSGAFIERIKLIRH